MDTGARTICIDLETGGLNRYRHPIIQIAAVAVTDDHRLRELDRFEVKIRFDEADCHAEALKKSSYDRRLWAQHGVEPTTAAQRLNYFLREHATLDRVSRRTGKTYQVAKLFAHNAAFDSEFLFSWHGRLQREHADLFLPASRRVRCTLQRAYALFDEEKSLTPPPDYQLATLCQYFGIPFNEAHDALYDALATVELYRAMLQTAAARHQAAA